MKNKISFAAKLRYKFDNTLSKGIVALISWLALITLLMIILSAVIFVWINFKDTSETGELGFWEALWGSILITLGQGLIEGDTWFFRVIELIVLIGGIFVASTLIGILTTGLEEKLEDMRKGHSFVIEKDHTLILGWSTKIFTIISELVDANKNHKDAKIVIMADMDKVEMEDEIRARIPDTKTTRIICRTGNPIDLVDLEIGNFNDAKSIIILSADTEHPDTYVLKSVLALTNNPNRKKEAFHIVAEIKDKENMEAAMLVGNNETVFVQTVELIARVATQTCRQSGLSIIYTGLLEFTGDDIYFKNEEQLAGKKYQDILYYFEKSSVIGIMKGDKIFLNPTNETIFETGDKIICISKDDDTIIYAPQEDYKITKSAVVDKTVAEQKPERNIILGWNAKGFSIVQMLDGYVFPGSDTKIVSEIDISEGIEEIKSTIKNQNISYSIGDITKRNTLNSENIQSYNNVIILGNDNIETQEADAKTLIALLHIRNMVSKSSKNFNIVSEMYDIKNRELAEITNADDFIISDRIISLMISQLSENKDFQKVFDILFDEEGCEIYLKPAKNYITTNVAVNYYTVLESAALKNETPIGYRINSLSKDSENHYGIVVNPHKNKIITFSDEDKIIVISDK